jgi:hypothetical protein
VHHWGSCGWVFLFACALTFPKDASVDVTQQFVVFYENVGNVLPCHVCSEHYNAFLKENPVDLSDGARSLTQWLLTLRNEIDLAANKPTWSFIQLIQTYVPIEMAEVLFVLTPEERQEFLRLKKPKTRTDRSGPIITALSCIIVILSAAVICLACMKWCRMKKR